MNYKGTYAVVEVNVTQANHDGILAVVKRDSRDYDHIVNVALDKYLNERTPRA